MKKQLTIFQRQHCNGVPCDSYTLAAWHWEWSLTWRWILSWSKWYAPPGRQGFTFMRIYRGRGFNFTTGLNLPLIGHFRLQTQPNMRTKRREIHPLSALYINQGSLDAAADAYEAEYNKAHGIETPNVEVTGAARLYCAASAWTAGLCAFFRNSRIGVLLLQRDKSFFSYCIHTNFSNRTGGSGTDKPINDSLQYAKPILGVNESVGDVDAANRDSHDGLFRSSGRWISLGRDVPRLRIFFVSDRGQE